VHLLEGQLAVTIDDKVFDLKPGESDFAPRGVPPKTKKLRHRPGAAA
jgi:quercetin dioxygenase-like cupin family protein